MNSASEGLWHGLPLVLYPQTPEQHGVANRVAALGAGVPLTDPPQTASAARSRPRSPIPLTAKTRRSSPTASAAAAARPRQPMPSSTRRTK
ncbi:MAG: hypothetical protein ACLSGT_07925 [Oscillospiraceae bacterium]